MHMTNIMERCAAAGVVFFSFANVASAAWQAGLAEGKAASSSYSATVEPTSWTAVMSPIAGGVNGWAANQVFVYRGQIYLDGSKHWFREKNWLWVWLKIDGEVLLNDDRWYVETTGSITREPGWYDFEARFWSNPDNTRGPAGLKDKNGRLCGFGYMKGDAAPTGMTDCVYPEDDGSGTLFRYDDGTGFPGLNVFGDPENLGQPTPDYGLHEDVTVGIPYELECPECATNAAETIVYRCAGWELKVNDVLVATNTDENVRTCTYICANAADKAALTWKWAEEKYKLDVGVEGGGTVDVDSQFVGRGDEVTVTATPNAGMKFWKWTCAGMTGAERYNPNVTVALTEARTLVANFCDPANAQRIIRYVTPGGKGKQDGTSWDDAFASVAKAYASAGDNPVGGEVWIKTGRYTETSGIDMLPNVTVRGGFAGTETSADEADPEAHRTQLWGFGESVANSTWSDGSPMWGGDDYLTFYDPPDKGDDDFSCYHRIGDVPTYDCFRNKDGCPVGEAAFYGIDFCRYYKSAIEATNGGAGSFVFRQCRWLGCGWKMHSTAKLVWVVDRPVDMADCAFVGSVGGLWIKGNGETQLTNVVKNCRFFSNSICWAAGDGAGGVYVGGNAVLTLRNCNFDRSGGAGSGGNRACIVLCNNADTLIEDCVIRRGDCSARSFGGGILLAPTKAVTLTLNRCRLECNRYDGTGADGNGVGAAIGIQTTGGCKLRVTDTAFIGNFIKSSSSKDTLYGSVLGWGVSCSGSFVNCLFEGNRAVSTASSPTYGTFATWWNTSRYFAFVNCVFKDNECGYEDADGNFVRRAEFVDAPHEGTAQCYAFVNTVFEHAAADYQPANTNARCCAKVSFASCTVSNKYDFGASTSGMFRLAPLDAEVTAGLEPSPRTNGVVVARQLQESSDYRRVGRPVWRANDGELYLYDATYKVDKPWRLVRNPTSVLTDAEALAKGVSRTATPIPDAFAKDRSKFKTALGQLDFGVPGMMLFVK